MASITKQRSGRYYCQVRRTGCKPLYKSLDTRSEAITPAVSPEGVAVKLRLAEHNGESLPDNFGFDLVQVARLDAERLARGGVA